MVKPGSRRQLPEIDIKICIIVQDKMHLLMINKSSLINKVLASPDIVK